MGSFSTLEIGKRSLLAQRLGLDITSNNVANANTPGYSRRSAVISQADPRTTGNSGFVGSGSVMEQLRTFREEIFDKEIRRNSSRESGFNADSLTIKQLESIVNEPSDNTLGDLVNDFFNSYEEVSTHPQDVTLRSSLINKAEVLVDRFHSIHAHIKDLRESIHQDIGSNVSQVNSLLTEIAALNEKISGSKAQNANDAINYIDQREEALENLSKLVDINVTQGNSGMANVFINGINVITGKTFNNIKAIDSVNSISGEKSVQLYTTDSQGNILFNLNPQSGEIYSKLKHYNVTLDGLDSSSGYSVIKKLDEYADAIVKKVNSLSVSGFGLDDVSPVPPGRNFFDPVVGTVTSENIAVSNDVKNPRNIPASDSPNEPGNSAVALAISRLSVDNTFLDNASPSGFYASFTGKVGNLGSEALTGLESSKLISQQLTNQRDSIIGVNLDEEAVNIIKFQKAFEASSRIVTITNEMLSIIVNLGR